jgi:hypothetical protein
VTLEADGVRPLGPMDYDTVGPWADDDDGGA